MSSLPTSEYANSTPTTPEALDSFDRHHTDILHKHKDEVLPQSEGPFAVAVVSRAYRELSNGNLTEKLFSLVRQTVSPSEFRAYIAVNNVRAFAVAADVYSREHQQLEELPFNEREEKLRELTREELKAYEARGVKITENDYKALIYDPYHGSKVWLLQGARDYRENEATLAILKHLTVAVNASRQEPRFADMYRQGALQTIRAYATPYLTEPQILTLLQVSESLMKKGISVMGVDCSSFSNATSTINHGQATNEAAHIALEQGAKYIDVSDMDEFHGPNDLEEIVTLANESKVDVLIRPLRVIVPQHPEELRRDSPTLWLDLVNYYALSLTHDQERYSSRISHSSGTQIVSAKAFRKHEYPNRGKDEDIEFADRTREDPTLIVRYALESELQLANRERPISWDGRISTAGTPHASLESLRNAKKEAQKKDIQRMVFLDTQLRKHLQDMPDFLKIYEEKRRQFFEQAQEQRIQYRRIFLGIGKDQNDSPNGILTSIFAAWQDSPNGSADQIVEAAHLKPWQKAFLSHNQNPLLVPALMQEMKKFEEPPSLLSVIHFIEYSLPELFGPPLTSEPQYEEYETLGNLNIADWMHLQTARRWFQDYITNLDRDGLLPANNRSALLKAID